MDRKLRIYLSDILSSILEIESFMVDRPKEYATFCNEGTLPMIKATYYPIRLIPFVSPEVLRFPATSLLYILSILWKQKRNLKKNSNIFK